MKALTFLIVVIFLFGAVSCSKKSNSPDGPDSNSIIGKWSYVSRVDWVTPIGSSVTNKDTIIAEPDSYADFRTDGRVYVSIPMPSHYYYDTIHYSVSSDKISFAFHSPYYNRIDTAEQIQTLTANELILHSKFSDSVPGQVEIWAKYRR